MLTILLLVVPENAYTFKVSGIEIKVITYFILIKILNNIYYEKRFTLYIYVRYYVKYVVQSCF